MKKTPFTEAQIVFALRQADTGGTVAEVCRKMGNGTLISYPGFPHGMPVTEAATINTDLLAFMQR